HLSPYLLLTLRPHPLLLFFFRSSLHHPLLHSFPTRRSSDLPYLLWWRWRAVAPRWRSHAPAPRHASRGPPAAPGRWHLNPRSPPDRKSTRLNSSHQIISYAVFCLKKKKTKKKIELSKTKYKR